MAQEPKRFHRGIVFKNISDGPNPSDTNPSCNISGHAWVIDTSLGSTVTVTALCATCNTLTSACHTLSNNQLLKVTTVTCAINTCPAGSIALNDKLYVICSTCCTFKVSATRGGSAICLQADSCVCVTFTLMEEQLHVYLCSTDEKVLTDSNTLTITNKTHTSPILNGCISGTAFLDEDCFCSNSATKLASQQSIKAYVDANITAQDLDFTDDCCTAGLSIDLDSETLKIAGGNGVTTSGCTNTLTITACHDSICGFVSNEHINHACVCLTAGTGLSGGGDLTASRTFNICINGECALTCPVSGDELLINDITPCAGIRKVTLANLSKGIVHDCTCGFVGNEHIDHSGVCLTAGAGLTGGGDLTSSRTFNVGAGTGICVGACVVSVDSTVLRNGSTNTVTGAKTFNDNAFVIQDCTTASKKFRFEATCISSCATRVITVPDANITLVGACLTQTLSNKTLASPKVTTQLCLCCQAEIRFHESCGCNYIALKAPACLSANVCLTLPTNDGDCGQALLTNGCGVLSWGSPTATVCLTVQSKTTCYTVLAGDDIIYGNTACGAFTLTLPAAGCNSGKVYRITKTDTSANLLTVDANGCELIFGQACIKLSGQYDSVEIASNGTAWYPTTSCGHLRTVYATISGNGTCAPTVSGEVGEWISSTSRSNFGIYGICIVSGIFSGAPAVSLVQLRSLCSCRYSLGTWLACAPTASAIGGITLNFGDDQGGANTLHGRDDSTAVLVTAIGPR